MSDAELETNNNPEDVAPESEAHHAEVPQALAPESPVQEWDTALGGFSTAGPLLEFDQVLERIASFTRTVVGGERARALAPTRDLLEIATRLQETTEARQYLE